MEAGDFKHLGREMALLTQYLASARISNRRGVNILIYGPPGTGKTQYARWLAGQMKLPLYQVKTVDDEGNPIRSLDRHWRISSCRNAFCRRATPWCSSMRLKMCFRTITAMSRRTGQDQQLFINQIRRESDPRHLD